MILPLKRCLGQKIMANFMGGLPTMGLSSVDETIHEQLCLVIITNCVYALTFKQPYFSLVLVCV